MKNIIGLFILTIGLLFLLSNTGLINTEVTGLFSTFWPVLIILIGLKVFFEGIIYFFHSIRRDKWHIGKTVWGAFILAIGVILLGNNAEWFSISLADLWSWTWPVLIVYIGIKILFNKTGDIVINLGPSSSEDDSDHWDKAKIKKIKKKWKSNRVKYNQFIGDIQMGKQPWELDGADVAMGIGDINVDLTKAILKEGENVLNIAGWIGSVKILVPRDMALKAFADVRLGEVTLFDDSYSGTSRNATYTSENFYEAEKKVILHVNLNIGDVEVMTVD
ncbi:lia operon protein LiaF [Evansella vedderi]|uniref:Lia operon protein LiaF n=1 Tax=Evansella vedderi TaxID=38282 RepID=A0ABT9ZX23_9BACI|nr:cell wall-active antibiotics response protein LiaF [Evansella vedderi]MDQ0255414.1 lia operon protein LiaF [Evansella vedderi]